MKTYLRSRKETILNAAVTGVFSILSIALCYSLYSNIVNIFDGYTLFMTFLTAALTACVCTAAFISWRISLTHPFADEDGVGIERCSKTIAYIRWEDIQDAGMGKALTVLGYKERTYFAAHKLSDYEKENLDIYDGEIISFTLPGQDSDKDINTLSGALQRQVNKGGL